MTLRCCAARRLSSAPAQQLAAEGLQVEPVLDTFRMHTVEVGQVTVRAGADEGPAALRGPNVTAVYAAFDVTQTADAMAAVAAGLEETAG